MQEKSQINMLPKISNFFHQKSHDPNYSLLSPLSWWSDHLGCSLVPSCDDTLADSSAMNIHPVWIMAQVPPGRVVIMTKTILFRRTVFLIKDILVFSKDRLCWLSFKSCWVNLVRAIMSSRPTEGKKMAAKWSYHRKVECANPALRRGKLAALVT